MAAAHFLGVLSAAFAFLACTASTADVPAVNCPAVVQETPPGACDLVATEQCSDGTFYEIDCADDATCTCVANSNVEQSIFVTDQTSGYCSSLNLSNFHDLSVQCGWNLSAN